MNVFLKFLKSKVPFLILVSMYLRNSDFLREIKHVFIIGMYLKKNGTDCSSRKKIPFIYINIHFALEWCVDSEKGFMHFFFN